MVDSVSSPVGSVDHLSPPSTSSRLSDSEPDPSDPGDGDDGGGGMGHGHHRSSRHSRAMERGGRCFGQQHGKQFQVKIDKVRFV